MLEEAGEVLQALRERPGASCLNFPDWATQVTLDEALKEAEGVGGEESAAHPLLPVHEPLGKDLGIREETKGVVGIVEVLDEMVEALLHPHADEMFEEVVHPHPLVAVAVEGGVGASLEEEVTEELRPRRRPQSSRPVSHGKWPPSRFGAPGWQLGNWRCLLRQP